jgi:hypothetical protein
VGKITELFASNMSLGTGSVLAVLQTAASGSAASNIFVKRVEVSQNASTTLAMCRLEFATRNTAGTLTTTSTTPVTIRPLGGAASGLAGNTSVVGGTGRSGTNSSADSGGTYTTYHASDFANTSGYLFKPDPTEEVWIPPSTVWCVRFTAAPGTTTGWTIAIILDEN